ncbi:hypothetical protein BEL04_04360 [Mucilaginibacter sp. PPCGB 2223]|uniref:DUF3347 domain-containing protein n=1 Tax=Mucilaginibacter sp. PPCGB 2223 TaxID=1886027 RepID=UPI000825BE81|nr:DUF3347 domain-containing protein [Mucilaginibacter sp. PPCGB 2223]OCX53538.1 hypothetical protein BEL04_04360 [Mucilaginibacter sp. PPCGB 2223]
MKTLKYCVAAILLLIVTVVKAGTNTSINKVLAAYLEIKNALADDDNKLANQKALAFTAALKEVDVADLDAKQKTTWIKYSEKLRFDGDHIGESAAIAHQREHFASLSKNMYAVVKALKANEKPVYMEYCPMKKESWLSESQTIKNPYYGKSMSECGKVTETLNGSK